MSQFPPPPPPQQQSPYPPQAPYPPQQTPPGGYGQPPMAPPPYGQGYPGGMPGPKKANGAAIASLVCGLLFCIPGITGLLAIILGIVGIKVGGNPQRGGRGMAIAGLILGLLSMAGWGLMGGGIIALVKGTSQQRELTRQFVNNLATGNLDAAEAQTDGTMPREELDSLSQQMQKWGPLKDTTIIGVSAEPGKTQVGGSAQFGSSPKSFQAVVLKQPDGSYKISSFAFQ